MKKNISPEDSIFIAGSNGMAGSAIHRSFLKYGYGNVNSGGVIYVPTRKKLDLSNKKLVNEWFERFNPRVVVLAAAKVGGINANSKFPADFLLENLKIQTNVIEAAWKNKVKRFLFLGSSCIYPKFADQPIKEESLLTSELEPTNEWYAIAKIAGIKLCQALRIQYGFDAISLMPTNLYGPGDNYHSENSHVMASLLKKFYEAKKNNAKEVICWGTGSSMREFMHVDDLGEAAIFSLENWYPEISSDSKGEKGNFNYLNVGTGKDISIKELAHKIASFVSFDGKIIWDASKPNGTPKKQLDVSRLKAMGWIAKIGLDEGIKSTLLNINNDLKNR